MVTSSTLKLPLFLLCVSLSIVGCSSDGNDAPAADLPEKVDDPEPSAGGAPATEPEPGATGGVPSESEPSKGGKGGKGGSESEPEPSAGAASEPMTGGGGAPDEEPEPTPRSEAELRGEALVKDNGCVTCHQANFAGFSVFPNITPDEVTGIGGWSDEQIISAIRDGIDADGASMCPTMARYPFDDAQAADIVAFLRALEPVASKAASACPGHG